MGLFEIALKEMDNYLGGKLYPDADFWSKLQDAGILQSEQIQTLQNNEKYVTSKAKVVEMLKLLRARDDKYYAPFRNIIAEISEEAAARLTANVTAGQLQQSRNPDLPKWASRGVKPQELAEAPDYDDDDDEEMPDVVHRN